IEPFENAAFPAAGCTLGGHAFLRVPAAAVGFPGHLGALADLLQLEIAVTRFFGGIRIILLALDMRSGSEHTSQNCRRVRHQSAGAAIPRSAALASDDVLGSALSDHLPAGIARLRPKINHPVSRLD